MKINTESSKEVKISFFEKVLNISEKLSAFLLIFPFVSVAFGLFQEKDYFFFFPLGLLLFLPIGVFALAIQIFKIIRIKQKPIPPFNAIIFSCSVITMTMGILGCMLLYVAVG